MNKNSLTFFILMLSMSISCSATELDAGKAAERVAVNYFSLLRDGRIKEARALVYGNGSATTINEEKRVPFWGSPRISVFESYEVSYDDRMRPYFLYDNFPKTGKYHEVVLQLDYKWGELCQNRKCLKSATIEAVTLTNDEGTWVVLTSRWPTGGVFWEEGINDGS